ncbi:MAG: hypothetical protein E7Z87_03440 [Cyanobacteria bacterium SIG26]|nr:hypothetical protein [Cyanobacteria bacterium SIG26]
MLIEEIKYLFNLDTKAVEENEISSDLLFAFDKFLEQISSEDYTITDESFFVYKKFVSMRQEAPEAMKKNLFGVMHNYIKEKNANEQYSDVLFMFRFLMVKSVLPSDSYYQIAIVLSNLGNNDLAYKFLKLYEKKETNRPLLLLTLGNFYNLQLKDYKNAIKYYEKYTEIDETKSVVYTILASLYAKLYGDLSLKDQVYYFLKAYNIKPKERLTLHGLAFAYDKLGDKNNANRYYQELLSNNPTETDYYNYGAFLISCGEFEIGHKYFSHRFLTCDKNLEYPLRDIDKKWDFKSDISDKILLVHYEQGFGDTFMYCRFVPALRNLAKKIIFVVQDEVYDLIKKSKVISQGISVLSKSMFEADNVKYDVSIALLDAPYALGTNVKEIPFVDGYIDVSKAKIKDYAKKHLKKTSKLKVGFAYSGDRNANYNGRDIDFRKVKNLLKSDNIEFYSLQVGYDEDGVNSLGQTFENFVATACAIKNMDVVVSTDNVILNLAGALGVKTLGLFNKYTNYRWYKLDGENVGWYDSVKPIQASENNGWNDVFAKVNNILVEYINNFS